MEQKKEPVAIIGIGCRYPGGVNSPQAFWELLTNKTDAITETPANRFNVDAYFDATPAEPGKIATRQGGFIDHVDQFDAAFFGISPREAASIDPQQRLLLETAWEALEDAGQTPDQLAGSKTGVFVGMWANEYEDRMYAASDDIDLYVTTGGGRYAASGRLSYTFDLRGPSVTIDTACSSSLVAVHQACHSLQLGEATLALAGGVNLILQPQISIGYSRSKMLSPDGRCKFGDATANGYVRSEGAGIVVLKLLSQAIADNDPIYAAILGSAVNNDGKSSGLLVAPGGETQAQMMREAYRQAGISPGDVGYIEAHGTGTKVGDPIELQTIGSVVAKKRPANRPCIIGSVKTNIGHTEAASGVAGLIKTALILKHQQIPANLHFNQPNPKIPWDNLPLAIQKHLTPWPDASRPAYAGVNSFGVTGTNAHIVLSEAPQVAAEPTPANAKTHLLPLSAHTPQALRAAAESYRSFLTNSASSSLPDIAYTAARRRTHHPWQLAVAGETAQQLADELALFLQTPAASAVVQPEQPPKVVFVCPGQGSQWLGMARELLTRAPPFHKVMEACDTAIRREAGWSVLEQLALAENAAEYRLNEISVIQPTLFAIEVALAAVWQAWGIQPDAVIGHSMGEVAAAYIAGSLNLKDSVRVICQRSQLMQRTSGQGAMAVVGLPCEQAETALQGYEDKLSVAVHNSPQSTVLSGDPAALDTLMAKLSNQDIFCRKIKVDVASHSPQMDPLRAELEAALQNIQPQAGSVPIYSTAAKTVSNGSSFNAEYWGVNLRRPVQFTSMVQQLLTDDYTIFIELSPHPILLTAIQEIATDTGKPAHAILSLRRNQPEQATLLNSLGQLYSLGCAVNWQALYPTGKVTPLPAYPWQRERFWLKENHPAATQTIGASPHQNLAPVNDDWLYDVVWQPVTFSQKSNLAKAETWLIFSDESGVGQVLAQQLQTQHQQCLLVSSGKAWATPKLNHWVVNPANPDDMRALFKQIDGTSLRGIIHLWSLDAPVSSNLTATALEATQRQNCGSVLHLLQTLAQFDWQLRPRLWLVTQGAQPVADAPLAVAQSPLWGLGRVVAEEHPEFWGGLIDLDPTTGPAENAASLLQIIATSQPEDQLALRHGQLYAARLTRAADTAPGTSSFRWRTDGTYLITGGLGGVGVAVARWAIQQGARRLLLLGRTPIPPRATWNDIPPGDPLCAKIAAIKELEAMGAAIHNASADIADPAQVMQVLDDYARENWPPIRGVFHAAGVLKDHSLLQLDFESLLAVLRPKIQGGWILHNALPELDCFVLFSSINALVVQPGQSNYAAANAFLDALVHHRRQQNLPATGINWGVWQELGMLGDATGQKNARQMAQEGIHGFTAAQGVAILDRVLRENRAQTVAASVDWQKLHRARPARQNWPLLTRLIADGPPIPAARPHLPSVGAFKDQLAAAHPDEQTAHLQTFLQEQVGQVLRLSPNRILPNQPLGSLGLDSLMAVELRNRLEVALDLKLSATLVWNYPTINSLAPYLATKLGLFEPDVPAVVEKSATTEPQSPSPDIDFEQLVAKIETLSDDDALQDLLGANQD